MGRDVYNRDNFDIILTHPGDIRAWDPLAREGTIGVKTVFDFKDGIPVFYGAWARVSDVLWYLAHHDEIADILMEQVFMMDSLSEASTPPETKLINKEGRWQVEK